MANNQIKKIGVLTSGGDAPGMNAAIRAVARTCATNGIECVGIKQGYKGLLEEDFEELTPRSVGNIINRGGSFLRSARCKEFKYPEVRQKAADNARKAGIDALVVIGGDGSFTGALKLQQETGIPVMGIPGTIDNDIYGSDYSIGFDTAINSAMEAIDKIRDTAAAHDRIFFVEVMGHGSGYIAVYTGIATGVEQIIMPPKKDEENHSIIPDSDELYDDIVKDLREAEGRKKSSSIIIVSENGQNIGERVRIITEEVKKRMPDKDIKETTLGHIQRGGSPTTADRVLATRLGTAAVEGLLAGERGKIAGVRDNKIVYTPLRDNTKPYDLTNDFDVKRTHDTIEEFRRVANIMNS